MVTVGVLSDTHGLLREEALRELEESEIIVHAGDVGDASILHRLEEIAPVRAVRGNTDVAEWATRLPRTRVVEVSGAVLYVVHDIEDLDLEPAAAGFDVVVYGHSHRPDATERDGVLYFNPGAAGHRRFRLPVTVGRLRVSDAGVVTSEIVHLEPGS